MESWGTDTAHFADGLCAYFDTLIEQMQRCAKNNAITAIHTDGSPLQVFRQFQSCPAVADSIRRNGGILPAWDEWSFWKIGEKELKKLERDVLNRMKRHSKQLPVYTRGVLWDWRPVLIHAYKFEPDPVLKLELIIPPAPKKLQLPDALSLQVLSDAIELHDYLVSPMVAEPLPFYTRHDTNFITLFEHLEETMPRDTAAWRLVEHAQRTAVNKDGASHSQSEWKAEAPSLNISSFKS